VCTSVVFSGTLKVDAHVQAVLDTITDEWESVIDPDVSQLVAPMNRYTHDSLVQSRGPRFGLAR